MEVGKNPCKKCQAKGGDRSGNNYHFYGEGLGGHCFSCGFSVPSDAFKEENGMNKDEDYEDEVMTREKITEEEATRVKSYTGVATQDYRGIRTETSKPFGVRYQYDEESGEVVKMFVPTTIDGEHVGYRTRKLPKDFTNPIGQVGKECDMVGEFVFKSHNHTVIISGGETKMLTTYQMLKDDMERRGKNYDAPAVVCSTLGESGAHKQIQSRYEFFDKFQKIIICMDNDKAGIEATAKIAKVLPKGRVYTMTMRFKDADDYLKAGKEREFVTDFWNAAAYTPAGIVGSGDLPSRMRAELELDKIMFPPFMRKVNEMTDGGLALGKICNIGAASGIGKTVYVDSILYFLVFNSPHRVGIVSMELNAGQYGISMLSMHIGRKIAKIADKQERIDFLNSEKVKEQERDLFFKPDGSHRFHLVDDRDGTIEDLKAVVEQLIIACDCKVIVLDPIQDILDGLSNEEQALFLKWQKGLLKSHNVTFININHVRKSGGGGQQNSAGAMISEEDFAGSSTIFKSAAVNILLVRDKMNEDPVMRNTTKAFISKNRDGGETGPAGEYYYDNLEHRLYDKEEWLASQPEMDFTDPDTGEVKAAKFKPSK